MSHQPKPVVKQGSLDTSCIDPSIDFVPALRVIADDPGDLVKANSSSLEDVGNLGDRACRTKSQPFARHCCPVSQTIEACVIDCRSWCEIQNYHWNPRALNHGQDR